VIIKWDKKWQLCYYHFEHYNWHVANAKTKKALVEIVSLWNNSFPQCPRHFIADYDDSHDDEEKLLAFQALMRWREKVDEVVGVG
jgi:hypothetical protein